MNLMSALPITYRPGVIPIVKFPSRDWLLFYQTTAAGRNCARTVLNDARSLSWFDTLTIARKSNAPRSEERRVGFLVDHDPGPDRISPDKDVEALPFQE